jgi:hypothetical protein
METNFNIPKKTIRDMESWKKKLFFLEQENDGQKNKLVEVLKANAGKNENLLEIAEQYQNRFLQQDETLRLMWIDLAKLEKSANEEATGDTVNECHEKEVSRWQERLKNEIEILDNNFTELKNNFDSFLESFFD